MGSFQGVIIITGLEGPKDQKEEERTEEGEMQGCRRIIYERKE